MSVLITCVPILRRNYMAITLWHRRVEFVCLRRKKLTKPAPGFSETESLNIKCRQEGWFDLSVKLIAARFWVIVRDHLTTAVEIQYSSSILTTSWYFSWVGTAVLITFSVHKPHAAWPVQTLSVALGKGALLATARLTRQKCNSLLILL